MDSDEVETDEDILTFEVADDALERAAVVTEMQVTTIGDLHSLVSVQLAAIASGKDFTLHFTLFCRDTTTDPNVRFGSKADIGLALVDVRFTPKSGHSLA